MENLIETRWKKNLLFIFAAQLLSIAGFSFAFPFLPYFIEELGVSAGDEVARWTGLLHAATAFMMAWAAPVWGILSDRFGRKLMVVRAMFSGTLILFLLGMAQTVETVFILRLMQGMFTGTITACLALTASIVPDNRQGQAMGLMQAAIFAGNTFGPFAGGLMADYFGYRNAFFCGSLMILSGALSVLFFVDSDRAACSSAKDNRFNNLNTPGKKKLPYKKMIAAAGLFFLLAIARMNLLPMIPLYIKEIAPESSMPATLNGGVNALLGISAIVAGLYFGKLSDTVSPGNIIIRGALLTAPAVLLLYFNSSLIILFPIIMMVGFFGGGLDAPLNKLLSSSVPRESRGKAFGFAASFKCIGWGTASLLAGFTAGTFGIRTVFAFGSGYFLLFALAAFLITRSLSRRYKA